MKTRLPFNDLVQLVGISDLRQRLASTKPALRVGFVDSTNPKFVAPDFLINETAFDPTAQVLFIAAPAAVGKSSLAAELAAKTGNLLWDLSRFSLGSAFFSGALVDNFGSHGLNVVTSSLETGAATLILDAADEALVRAGARNFEAAIDNLASLVKSRVGGGPAAIMLGRPDTVADAYSYLSSLGVAAQVAEVAFFAESDARRFVRTKAESSTSAHGVAVAELDEFLTTFFASVRLALGAISWDASEEFLGYAPVLDALATFYRDEPNPLRRLNELSRAESSAHVWDLLIEVISAVLEREAEKFGNSFGGADPRKKRFGAWCYRPEAQLRLLIADSPDQVDIDFPIDDADDSWLDGLEGQVAAQYREHPFLRATDVDGNPLQRFANVAFRDFVVATALAGGDTGATERLVDYWTDPVVSPSPILSRFLMAESMGIERVGADALAIIADSHASGFQASLMLDVEVEKADFAEAKQPIEITLYESGKPLRSLRSECRQGAALHFVRGLARTAITAPSQTIVVGSGAQDFAVGPDVFISCSVFDSEAAEVRVRGDLDHPSDIQTQRVTGTTRRVSSPQAGSLRITVPSAAFPWQAYVQVPSSESVPDSALTIAGMDVRKNTKWYLRESMIGGLNYPITGMEAILAKGRASDAVHHFMLDRGYLKRSRNTFELTFDGFSATTVLDNNIKDNSYRDFLVDYLNWRTENRWDWNVASPGSGS